jgi:hypothetical protein
MEITDFLTIQFQTRDVKLLTIQFPTRDVKPFASITKRLQPGGLPRDHFGLGFRV